jgi:arabinofuranan 3-O-arabinosyltransferase
VSAAGAASFFWFQAHNLGSVKTAAATHRLPALANRRFRGLLLIWMGIPLAVAYLWFGVLQPFALGTHVGVFQLGDFQESYLRAANRLAAGRDPYDLCRSMGCLEPTGPQYVMPPLLAWLLHAAVGLDGRVISIAVVVVLNLSLAAFLLCALRALKVDDWQLAALLVLVSLSFEPVIANVDEGQVNLVLLALSGVWLWAWVAERWWGGIALGAAVAVKLIQAPVGLLVLWARRWPMLGAAVATGLGLWVVAAPQYLLEYLFQVLPAISGGTGFFENHSPGGTVTRLLQPDTFFGAVRGSPPAARVITVVIAIIALAITAAVLRSPAAGATGRALEAAAIVAVTPMVASYSWGTHLVLLLLPVLVLIVWGVRRGDWVVLGLVAMGWLLIGPGHKWFQTLLVSGYTNLVVLRLMAEFGLAGIICVWIASLLAVRRQRTDLMRLVNTVPRNRNTTALENTTL